MPLEGNVFSDPSSLSLYSLIARWRLSDSDIGHWLVHWDCHNVAVASVTYQ